MLTTGSIRRWAALIKRDVVALWLAARDRRVPWFAKLVVGAVAACYVAFTLGFQRFLDDEGGAAGDYGVVYRDQIALAREVRERGLRMGNSPAIEVLVSGSFEIPPGRGPLVTVVNRLVTSEPLPCDGAVLSFGRIDACFPRG